MQRWGTELSANLSRNFSSYWQRHACNAILTAITKTNKRPWGHGGGGTFEWSPERLSGILQEDKKNKMDNYGRRIAGAAGEVWEPSSGRWSLQRNSCCPWSHPRAEHTLTQSSSANPMRDEPLLSHFTVRNLRQRGTKKWTHPRPQPHRAVVRIIWHDSTPVLGTIPGP